MNTITAFWRHAMENRRLWLVASAAAIVAGVLLIAIGDPAGWGWTRLIGAGVISLASIVFGVLIGWSEPLRPRIAHALYRSRKIVAYLLAALMAAPLLVGLVLGFAGLIGGSGSGIGVTLIGLVLTVGLLAITAGAVGIGVLQATHGLDRICPEENGKTDGQGSP